VRKSKSKEFSAHGLRRMWFCYFDAALIDDDRIRPKGVPVLDYKLRTCL